MKTSVVLISALAFCNLALAQVGTTTSEGAKAAAEKSKQYGDQAKASVASEPNKSVDKAKAKVHKVKAHHHAKDAKSAAKEIPK